MRKVAIFLSFLMLYPIFLMAQEMSKTDSILMYNAFMQNQSGNYEEALTRFLQVGQNTKQQRTEDERKTFVLSQTMAAMCCESLKQYEEGFRLSEELLKGNITDEERKDIAYLFVMNGYCMATSYISKESRRYAEARVLFDKILPYADDDMRQRILPKIPLTWYFEGTQYQLEQKYGQAFTCMEKARQGFHDLKSKKNEIEALCQIGTIKNYQYDTNGALEALQKACALAAETKNDVKEMSILRDMYGLYKLLGDNEHLLSINAQMDSLASTTEDNQVRFKYYNYQGGESKNLGNYDLAEMWYRKNGAYVHSLGDDYQGADRHLYYTNLRNLYLQAGRYEEALKYALLGKEDFQRRYAKDEPSYYMPYMNLADIYCQMGDSTNCYQCLDTLFLCTDRLDEPREKQYLYISRAKCYSKFKHYEQALADYKEADRLLATLYGEEDGDRMKLLPLMGGLEHKLGRPEETERLYRKYANGVKNLYGEQSQTYIDALSYLANVEGFAGHIPAACDDYRTAVNKLRQNVQTQLPYLSTAEREGYWASVSEMIRNMTPFALEAKEYQTAFTEACYNGLVLSKAFMLETERSTFYILKSKGTLDDQHDFILATAMHTKIKEWEKDRTAYADSILELTSRVRQLENRLAGRCRSYGDMTSFMSIGYQEVKKQLGDGDVLIDFTDYVSETRGRTYVAYVIDNKQEYPLLQKLFTESQIDSMQVAYPDQYYESPYAEKLHQLLWEPFIGMVEEGATVYYVPSQMLFRFALESLPLGDGTVLGEHYHFVRLSSARELVNLKKNLNIELATSNTNAVLYGGLLYDMAAQDWETEVSKYDVAPLLAVRGDILQGDSIPLLPGSKKEVDAIEHVMKEYGLTVELLTGKRGTEESFISMSGKAPQMLHIATHGFFYTPEEVQAVDYLQGYKDAMSLSGLIMSGGNAAWTGKELPEGVLGGILTAANIARLDLGNTELVVLSACHSGKGQATPEGLYGLQRAFKKAGVQTMIMSLWNVSDVVGTEFMTLFYKNLLDRGNNLDKRRAFEKTKSAIRGKYPEAFYWAGFVMLD